MTLSQNVKTFLIASDPANPLCFGDHVYGSIAAERHCSDCHVYGACKEVTAMPKEADPSGLKPSDPGAKLDAGKLRVDLLFDGFALALHEVAKVCTFGANKYSEGGWKQVDDGVKRYRAAGDRHRLKRVIESHDPDSNILHLAHECWNRLAELELTLKEMK